MALSTVVKNFRDGSLVIKDATAVTPLDVTVTYENGDFSLQGLSEGQKEVTAYQSRGALSSLRYTNQTFPTLSFTAQMTEFSDATNENMLDMVLKQNAFSAAVSTYSTATDAVFTLNLAFTVEGSDHGDSADHSVTLDDVRCTIDFAEGDPNTFTINGTVYGTITWV